MASDKIRIGVIGANVSKGWAHRSHLPALMASPEFELTGVCTTHQETAEESKARFGARLAFHDHQDMLASPEIDAVSIVVRVPSHYQLTVDALNAGKHVYTEWPLGKDLAEAQELADLARAKGVQTMVGLQARAAPAVLYMKELVDSGYVGEVMSCHLSLVRGGVLERTSDRTWQRDDSLGATTLTIACGHAIDALRFVVGDFSDVSSVVATQASQWHETDTQQMVDVTAPDNILVSGNLAGGGVASVHVASVPWSDSGLRMEIYGREGSLMASGDDSPQLGAVRLQGAKIGDANPQEMEIPARHVYVLEGMPSGAPYNVGQMYYRFGEAIRSGVACEPNFDTAVELHKFLDAIRASSD
ncbi:MAG: Gfo/Idh/MocA family oxidoreductase, partial [Chloroflexi bacterium]|nr:Gfo/Idh/MocA family oxidoreductase [Chloroflexota bacterium]